MDDTTLYDTDFMAWTEAQAAALRALAGQHGLPNGLDLENVIEEIETLGRSELKAATSPMRLIMEHLIKLRMEPRSTARQHWRAEIIGWHQDILQELTPAMHRRVVLDDLWQDALRRSAARLKLSRTAIAGLPTACPFALDDFTDATFDPGAALRKLDPTVGA